MDHKAIVIGSSHTNMLGLVRSLGEAGVPMILILVGSEDSASVLKSRYLIGQKEFIVHNLDEVLTLLLDSKKMFDKSYIICTGDSEAEFIDLHEDILWPFYITPARGGCIGSYFNKETQYDLAKELNIKIPKSIVFQKGNGIENILLRYPILTKPFNSADGCKGDIHVCKNQTELRQAIFRAGACNTFILQEFIDKDYEINTLGVRTENGVIWGGSIQKYRHNPWIVGSGTFAKIYPVQKFGLPLKKIEAFLNVVGYYGPFSVEFLHKSGENYFLEVNFRNDGLGHVATSAGMNLPALYVDGNSKHLHQFKSLYMMNVWLDFSLVYKRKISIFRWLIDLLRSRSFIDFDYKDMKPFFSSLIKRFKKH